jgi:hypothetical protein
MDVNRERRAPAMASDQSAYDRASCAKRMCWGEMPASAAATPAIQAS